MCNLLIYKNIKVYILKKLCFLLKQNYALSFILQDDKRLHTIYPLYFRGRRYTRKLYRKYNIILLVILIWFFLDCTSNKKTRVKQSFNFHKRFSRMNSS